MFRGGQVFVSGTRHGDSLVSINVREKNITDDLTGSHPNDDTDGQTGWMTDGEINDVRWQSERNIRFGSTAIR